MLLQGISGPQTFADGAPGELRLGRLGEAILSVLHGRFYEQNYRGNVFSGGMSTLTSISAATFAVATLTAAATPIIGLWNPPTSPVMLSVLSAQLQVTLTAIGAFTGAAPFVWATSIGNSAISTGAAPFGRKTFLGAGSYAKDVSGVALTGLTNNLVVRNASALGGGVSGNFAFSGTASGQATCPMASFEAIDCGFMIPPGGVLALLATTQPVAHSATSGIVWEETPIN